MGLDGRDVGCMDGCMVGRDEGWLVGVVAMGFGEGRTVGCMDG